MRFPVHCRVRLWPALLLALSACGGGGAESGGPATIRRTLAYVVSVCHEDAAGASMRQSLQVRRGDQAPVTVAEIPTVYFPALGLCPLYGQARFGLTSTLVGALQRIGLSPDGSGVVFEITYDYSILLPFGFQSPLRPDQEGIFYVRADGSGLRRLGDASRVPDAAISGLPSASGGFSAYLAPFYAFSPDGRLIAFTDRGPGPEGDAIQIVTLDLTTGARTQVTRLPSMAPPDVRGLPTPATVPGWFSDNETIVFWSRTNPDGLNPNQEFPGFSIKTDGTNLKLFLPSVFPGAPVDPNFRITPGASTAALLYITGIVPVNPLPAFSYTTVEEVFSPNAEYGLQLTNFRRVDTATPVLSIDRQRVFFAASANPLGINPTENCQLFSIDTLGGDLRQLTHFRAADHSEIGCLPIPGPGCYVFAAGQDPETESLLLMSTCDPLGTNPNGLQIFVMRPDGTGLRQLTDTRGMVTAPDGSADVELPGPEFF